jgi:ribosomal protein S12 methylthiotransferase accessory factor
MENTDDPQLQRLLEAVSPRVGFIRSFNKAVRGVEEPSPPIIYQATLAHFDYRMAPPEERVAVGKGLTDKEAMRAAFGEAIEHYCAAQVDEQKTRLARWSDIQDFSISPAEFVLYSDSQYGRADFLHHKWKEDDEITWIPVRELPSGREIFAPASLVFLTSSMPRTEDRLTFATSNGLAAGPNLEFAILNGLCELVERDGFLIHWMNKLPAPEVDFSGVQGLDADIRDHYQKFGTQIRVFNLTTDLPIYVMMGIALDQTGTGPAAIVGLGCNLDPNAALRKCLLEICQTHPGEVRRFGEISAENRLKKYEDILTLMDHSAFLMMPGRLDEFSFLLGNGRFQALESLPSYGAGDVKQDLDTCIQTLVNAGCRVAFADLTTADIVDFGMCVVRAIATGLQPMHFGFGQERLGGRRIYHVPKTMGYATAVRTEADLNPCPHPLA